ncbi:MAG: hypothetical protein ACOCRX_05305 [Candidatus Woesearchaeota archaeon]
MYDKFYLDDRLVLNDKDNRILYVLASNKDKKKCFIRKKTNRPIFEKKCSKYVLKVFNKMKDNNLLSDYMNYDVVFVFSSSDDLEFPIDYSGNTFSIQMPLNKNEDNNNAFYYNPDDFNEILIDNHKILVNEKEKRLFIVANKKDKKRCSIDKNNRPKNIIKALDYIYSLASSMKDSLKDYTNYKFSVIFSDGDNNLNSKETFCLSMGESFDDL